MIHKERRKKATSFKKQYNVVIDTTHLPENSEERIKLVMQALSPVINQIIIDVMSIAIGTWPTPESSRR